MQDQYKPYYETKHDDQEEKLKKIMDELPKFTTGFFRELSRFENKATSTLIAYATDLRVFFTWAKGFLPEYAETPVRDFPIDILSKLHVSDIKSYLLDYVPEYSTEITLFSPDGEEKTKEVTRKNTRTTSARKLSTLKKFYHYYNNLDPSEEYCITNDPVSSVKQARDNKKPVKYLDEDKTKALFECIDSGEGLNGKAQKWNELTRERDKAIIALFLGTGMRVSELAGINIQDINFEKSSIQIYRKEQRLDTIYMSPKVKDALLSYINGSRLGTYKPDKDNENALFLSYKHCRMSVSAIERCVKKYTQVVTGTDDYSCHKLRDTFGTRIYAETGGNAKKVQVALNHKSASTTLDYYIAAIDGIEKEATFTETEISGL